MMRPVPSTLRSSAAPLCRQHDVAMLDLDGVVYVGRDAVAGVPEALRKARDQGLRLAFVTNNAARPPQAVAEHLTELGIEAEAGEVITSAQAAARYLADHLPDGARVLVVGTTGLVEALRERGLEPVHEAGDRSGDGVAAVVQGYSPDLNWQLLAEGAVAIRSGALWVATNLDVTVPSPRGPLPGNGAMVGALRLATKVEPVATGKPDPTMHRETLLRTEAEHPLVVGDRLDTDIEGANAVGCPSLLVFSGVATVPELLDAPPNQRPTYLGADLSAILVEHPAPDESGAAMRCGRWQAARDGDALRLSLTDGPATDSAGPDPVGNGFDDDTLDAVRALCAARWSYWDGDGDGDDRGHVEITHGDETAGAVLESLGLQSD